MSVQSGQISMVGTKDFLNIRTEASLHSSIKSEHLLKIIQFDDYRIRQTAPDVIEVELGGVNHLSDDQIKLLKNLFKEHAGEEFQVRIEAMKSIDWGNDTKRLGFRCDVL